MDLIIFAVFAISSVYLFLRYFGWAFSQIIARSCGCHYVRLGRCGFFYVTHMKLMLHSGMTIEVDDLRLSSSLFNAQFAKPLVVTAGDVRIEGERKLRSDRKAQNGQKSLRLPTDVERFMHWLQYVGAVIKTARLVYLDAVPGCLLHSTFENAQLDAFRDREGLQLELSCSLAQAKLFSRGRAQPSHAAPLVEVSLGASLSADLCMLNAKVKKTVISITNPLFSLSDGLFEYLRDHPIRKESDELGRSISADRSDTTVRSPSKEFLSNLKLDVGNMKLRYIAVLNDQTTTRTLSASLNSVAASAEEGDRFSVALAGILLADHSPPRTHFRCTDFVINFTKGRSCESRWQVSVDIRIFNPCCVMCQNDLTSWLSYIRQLKSRMNGDGRFDDDFSTSEYKEGSPPSESRPSISWDIAISADVNALQCRLMPADGEDINIGIDLVTFNASDNFAKVELGLECLWVRRGATTEEDSPFSFERHSWGTALVLGAALAQYSRSARLKSVQIQLEECHAEYEDELVKQIAVFLCALHPSENPQLARGDTWSSVVPSPPPPTAEFTLQLSAKKLAVFLAARQARFVLFSVQHVRVDSVVSSSSLSLLIEKMRIIQGAITGKETFCCAQPRKFSSHHVCGEGDRVFARFASSAASNDIILLADSPVTLVWEPTVHIVFLEIFRSAVKIFEECSPKSSSRSSVHRSFNLNIDSPYAVVLEFRLPREHIMRWEVPSMHVQRNDNISFSFPELVARMDSHPILTLEKFSVHRRAIDARMDLGRAEFKNLTNRTNKVWAWSADSLSFLFPYSYNFAEAYDELINSWKWIKLVHGMKPKPFTVDSPLPSDLSFSIKHASLQLNDDPFEVQLQANYELMVDEVYECERRRQMLDQKLEQLRKTQPLLLQSKADELHRSLIKKNAEIYVERSKKAAPPRAHLVIWTIDNLEIHAYADLSLHGKDNAVRLLKMFNPEAPYPSEEMEFSTLWARAVELDFNEWTVQFRDYPLPYMLLKDGHFWGHLVGAEHLAGFRSIRNCTVELPEPWGEYVVDRNMCPLKFYYDLECEIADLNCTYGPCWEPCLSMIGLCWNNVNAPSRDPSAVLPFWDKVRLLLHGRFSMLCKHLVTSMLASTDPYNSTELVEISWKDFEFDWTTGQFCIQTDVNTFIRTASKYDDSRVLHLPGFKCCIQLSWACIGSPDDHHNAQPCAPDKLPEYSSTNHEHDSYRAFRSTHLDLTLNLEVKPQGELVSYSQYPQILLYANTFRWLEFLKNTLTTVNRPVKRGSLFGSKQSRKTQLSRHFKHVRLNVTLPRFLISYWMSFSSSHGFRMISESLHLTSSMELHIAPVEEAKGGVIRRQISKWLVPLVSAQLSNVQMHLFGENTRPMSDKFAAKSNSDSFFLGLDRLSYDRESTPQTQPGMRHLSSPGENVESDSAVHRLTIHDLRASWTPENRDTCLAIADGVHKAHILRKILSNDALKILNFDSLNTSVGAIGRNTSQSNAKGNTPRMTMDSERSPIRSRFGSDGRIAEENDMLQKLIDEAGTKLVAYSEEATDVPSDFLHGIALCSSDDVFLTNWQIDLINSQAVLRGKESDGFILLTAARASVTQRVHLPVWKKSQLLGKKSWCAILSGMQYFAPLVVGGHAQGGSPSTPQKEQRFRWLSREVIEEKACSDPNISDRLDNYINTGEAVGGVVADQGSSVQSEDKLQLQRVVSRCSCQMYFCYFSDTLDIDTHNMPLPINDLDDSGTVWGQKEPVDCFTLKHNMLEVSTNPQQYEMAMNIVNQLVLFVDPRKKEIEGKRQRLRFQNQDKTVDEVRKTITAMQAELRDVITAIRSSERSSFSLNRQLQENPNDIAVLEASEEVAAEIKELKKSQQALSDELAIIIGCYKEKQVERMRQLVDLAADEHALVARRFEVCFEDCIWRLTESDGQIALAEMQIRNFLYTRTARIDNSGEHLLEIGTVKVTNLLPDSIYKHTLQAQNTSMAKTERQPSIRLVCRDMAPVGGICVKEHFEINVSPMVAQITYRFFEKMMAYFFPGRNIDKEDQQNLDTADDQPSAQGVSMRQWLRGAVNGSFRRPAEANPLRDDIDRMKERAQENNFFLFIKIPEVPFIVSYKGSKEKNLEDVDRFQLVFPLCEYHDKNWTWLDLALAIKQRCRRVLLQQFMKQKLLRNRLMGAERETADSEVDEEEKKRIVLGPAFVPADKDKKKSKKSG